MPVLEATREQRQAHVQFLPATQVHADQQRKEGQSEKRLLQG